MPVAGVFDKSVETNNSNNIVYPHLYDETKVSKDFINSVNEDIENSIINIRNGNFDNVPDTIEVTKLSKETIKKISDFVGFDISEYSCKIEKDRLVHIENRHGINGEHDNSLADPRDIARMMYVINNSDNIEWVVDENGNRVYDHKYNNRNNTVAPVMSLSCRVDGTYCVSNVVPDTKRKTIWITSARIEKADVGSQVPNDNNVIPQPTSKTPLNSSSASKVMISQDSNAVNSEILPGAQNNSGNLPSAKTYADLPPAKAVNTTMDLPPAKGDNTEVDLPPAKDKAYPVVVTEKTEDNKYVLHTIADEEGNVNENYVKNERGNLSGSEINLASFSDKK